MLREDQLRPAVLVVEHATQIRINMVDLTDRAGCRAIEAISADEALLLLRQLGDIKVIFIDLDTPGSMDGLRLLVTARALCPTIGVIAVSGYGRPATRELPANTAFFAKPFSGARVIESLRQMAVCGNSVSFPINNDWREQGQEHSGCPRSVRDGKLFCDLLFAACSQRSPAPWT